MRIFPSPKNRIMRGPSVHHFNLGIYASRNVCVKDAHGLYGTSKLPKFYSDEFKHDLYCCTWWQAGSCNVLDIKNVPPV